LSDCDELYTVSADSSLQGQPCLVCGGPLQVGDVVTWRPGSPADADPGSYDVRPVHVRCLQAEELGPPRAD